MTLAHRFHSERLGKVLAIDASLRENTLHSEASSKVVHLNTPEAAPLITEFPPNTYSGCYQATAEPNGQGDALLVRSTGAAFEHTVDTPVTHETCVDYCINTAPGAPYTNLGIYKGRTCRCGNGFAYDPPIQAADSECNIPAAGNDTQASGGTFLVSVWSIFVSQLSILYAQNCALQT
ncbi:hypothetical protein BDW02DRAFT_596101 [Decorospora gaudefroyi]|uniref:WSC domain-containing protein n=1 Tax=Decorospora gaudefroyi TaxID=184978 RepID=A0A6A5KI08_9PLEO|nr:hypothetical protein BDW02DRAFT_596101 [Decorospora gaudefroyi]